MSPSSDQPDHRFQGYVISLVRCSVLRVLRPVIGMLVDVILSHVFCYISMLWADMVGPESSRLENITWYTDGTGSSSHDYGTDMHGLCSDSALCDYIQLCTHR